MKTDPTPSIQYIKADSDIMQDLDLNEQKCYWEYQKLKAEFEIMRLRLLEASVIKSVCKS